MKKIGIVIFLMLALAVLYSCQEYEMVQYGAGQQINFMGDYISVPLKWDELNN